MKKIYSLIVFVAWAYCGVAQHHHKQQANFQQASKYSSARMQNMVFSTSVRPNWLTKGDKFWYSYSTSQGQNYYLVDPVRKTKTKLFDNVKMAADLSRMTGDPFDAKHLSISRIEFDKSETFFKFSITSKLAEEEVKDENEGDSQEKEKKGKKKMKPKTWYFIFDIASQTLRIDEDHKEEDNDKSWAQIAPDKSFVLFARHHNLYKMSYDDYKKLLKDEKDSTVVEIQLTTDGVENYSYQSGNWGQSDDEIETKKDERQRPGYVLFSEDQQYFVGTRTDSRMVKDFWVINNVAQPRPTLETYKYHMAGEPDAPQVELFVFNVKTGEKQIVNVDRFKDQTLQIYSKPRKKTDYLNEENYPYLLSGTTGKFYLSVTSRDLKRVDICEVTLGDTTAQTIIEERLNTYIDLQTPVVVNNGQNIIFWSQRDGWGHYYLYDRTGKLVRQITSGPYNCSGIEAIDDANDVIYFTANGKENGDPYYEYMYKVGFSGSGFARLSSGDFNHDVNANDKGAYFVDNYSRVNSVPASDLIDSRGNKILSLETADLSKLLESGWQFPEPFTVKAGDGITDLYGVMYKPNDFDSTKKYPLLLYVYPGPQTEAVDKSFRAGSSNTDRMAQLGFVVITVGNRGGHPARSKWYHNYGYGNLRDYGLEDKKTAAEQIANRHEFVDINKVGIYGHSGGGFMSTAAMLVYPDFFKVAVSSSGNHENNIYNRWWSEKHHGVKEVVDYEGNVSFEYNVHKNPDLAKNLKGKLMLTTGDIDNNVHPAGTIRMANALIKANKRFDFFLFPGQRHGYGNMSEYWFWLRAEYFTEHLIGDHRRHEADYLEVQRDIPSNR